MKMPAGTDCSTQGPESASAAPVICPGWSLLARRSQTSVCIKSTQGVRFLGCTWKAWWVCPFWVEPKGPSASPIWCWNRLSAGDSLRNTNQNFRISLIILLKIIFFKLDLDGQFWGMLDETTKPMGEWGRFLKSFPSHLSMIMHLFGLYIIHLNPWNLCSVCMSPFPP